MGFGVNEIIAQLGRNALAKPYLYEVRIMGSSASNFTTPVPDAPREVMFNCSGVNVPGVNIGFTQDRRFGIGTAFNIPTSKSFTELNLTMYETEHEMERRFFVEWMDLIYDKNTKRFGYYKDIVKNLSIIQYDKTGKKTYECVAIDCFPSNLSPLDKGYASGENVPQFNVNIQFHELKEVFFDKQAGFNPFGIF